jgi:gpW
MMPDICTPCSPATAVDPALALPSCAVMMVEAITAYNAVRRSLMTGGKAVEVQYGDQRVKYDSTKDTVTMLLDDIRRLHMTCPREESAALLGMGGAGSVSPSFWKQTQQHCPC